MENWKKAVIAGSLGASAALFLKGKRGGGVLAAGVGVAILASEYPEKFEQIRKDMPRYIDSGSRFLEMASRMGTRFTQLAGDRGLSMWEELSSYR
jgi:hypothetical protein